MGLPPPTTRFLFYYLNALASALAMRETMFPNCLSLCRLLFLYLFNCGKNSGGRLWQVSEGETRRSGVKVKFISIIFHLQIRNKQNENAISIVARHRQQLLMAQCITIVKIQVEKRTRCTRKYKLNTIIYFIW